MNPVAINLGIYISLSVYLERHSTGKIFFLARDSLAGGFQTAQ